MIDIYMLDRESSVLWSKFPRVGRFTSNRHASPAVESQAQRKRRNIFDGAKVKVGLFFCKISWETNLKHHGDLFFSLT